MKIAWWNPREETPKPRLERPYLEAPSPYDYMPREPPQSHDDDDDDESPHVIIIDI